MTRIAVHFNDEITQGELAQILRDAGLHMRSEGHRLVVDRVPKWLAKEQEESNVVPLEQPKRRRRA